MPACVDDSIERRRALADFELLMGRPSNFFKLTREEQWEIDKGLGALDAWCEKRYITDEMQARWNQHFGLGDK